MGIKSKVQQSHLLLKKESDLDVTRIYDVHAIPFLLTPAKLVKEQRLRHLEYKVM